MPEPSFVLETLNIVFIVLMIIFILVILSSYFFDYWYPKSSFRKQTNINIDATLSSKNSTQPKIEEITPERLEALGLGGMDEYIDIINKDLIIYRALDEDVQKKLNIKPSKGIILYGPPGCGKTRIAVAISKMFSNIEPTIISGPSIYSKWIGESEGNIRDIFQDAYDDQKLGKKNIHVVVFDEFDAIGAKRGNSEHHISNNSVVNQLLAMMDGPDPLNNCIIIAITNRLDAIDEALLRPGRFGTHIEIKAPTLKQRQKILEIKTKNLKENNYLDEGLDFELIAELTDQYTGADLDGLVSNVVNDLICNKMNKKLEEKIYLEDFLKHITDKTIDKILIDDNSNSSKEKNERMLEEIFKGYMSTL